MTVADRGPGVVEPELLTHLMRTKSRSLDNGRDPRASSLDLGLTIAGWVARIHGGTLLPAVSPGPAVLHPLCALARELTGPLPHVRAQTGRDGTDGPHGRHWGHEYVRR